MASCGDGSRAASSFLHSALIYATDQEFMDVALPFVEHGIARSEPALVAAHGRNVENLRSALDAEPDAVTLLSVDEWYESAARTRDKFARWASERIGGHPRVRLIGEPPGETGNEAHVRDWARHESVINVAFAGMPVTFICPYDARALPVETIEHAQSTHPTIAAAEAWIESAGYQDPVQFCSRLNDRIKRPAGEPSIELEFGLADLGRIRQLVHGAAIDAGLPEERAEGFGLAVNEVATNAILHGRPPATLRIWESAEEVLCEVGDAGPGIDDPLAGQLVPPPDGIGGRGLWLARLVCDAVEIRSDGGSTVSLHMAAGAADPLPAGV
jgi:anti-sigma regulatory factor (Ser/Thr protein kinase)